MTATFYKRVNGQGTTERSSYLLPVQFNTVSVHSRGYKKCLCWLIWEAKGIEDG